MKKILLVCCLLILCGCAKTNQITLKDLTKYDIEYKEVDKIKNEDVTFDKDWTTYKITKNKKSAYYGCEDEGSKIICNQETYGTFIAPFVDENTLRRIEFELIFDNPDKPSKDEIVSEIGYKQYLVRIYHHEDYATIEFMNKVMERIKD